MTRRNHLPDIEMCRLSSRLFHGEDEPVKEIVIAKPASYRRRLVESGALILMGRGCQVSPKRQARAALAWRFGLLKRKEASVMLADRHLAIFTQRTDQLYQKNLRRAQ